MFDKLLILNVMSNNVALVKMIKSQAEPTIKVKTKTKKVRHIGCVPSIENSHKKQKIFS